MSSAACQDEGEAAAQGGGPEGLGEPPSLWRSRALTWGNLALVTSLVGSRLIRSAPSAFAVGIGLALVLGAAGLFVAALGALVAHLKFKRTLQSEEIVQRRAALRAVTGHDALPEWLEEEALKATFRKLERTWHKKWRKWGGLAEWRDAIQRNAAPACAPFLAALAGYDAALRPSSRSAQKLAAEAWALLRPDEPAAERGAESRSASDLVALDPDAARAELEASKRQRAQRPRPRPAEGSEQERQAGRARIRMRCPCCEEVSRIPLDFAGKRGLCPKCRGAIEVPAPRRRAA